MRLGLVGLAVAALVLSSCSGSTIAAGHDRMTIAPEDVLALQMVTPSDGVAVAFWPSPVVHGGDCCNGAPAHHRDYLVVTGDGGARWRVTGELPVGVNPSQSYGIQMAFGTIAEGYVESTETNAIVFTADAGRTWSLLHPPGQATSISLRGSVLWVVSNLCRASTTPPSLCPSRLLTYISGHLAPASDLPIPTEGIVASRGVSGPFRAASLLDRLGPSSAVVEEGSEGSPSSLLFTSDSGQQWTVLDDPCEGLVPTGLVAPTPTSWDLYCQLDGGMNQGETRFYTTSDQGKTWALTASANEQGNTLGSMGDVMADDLTLSSDGHVLWLLGSVGGIKSSTDGGSDWTNALVQTGGYPAELAVAGRTSAWLPLPGIGLYHTINGTSWSKIS